MSDKASVDNFDGDESETLSTASGGATAMSSSSANKCNYPGPLPGVKYPLTVIYCGGTLN